MDWGKEICLVSNWASLALYVYDVIIGLEQEVELVWRSKGSLPKYLYIVTRFIGLLNFFGTGEGGLGSTSFLPRSPALDVVTLTLMSSTVVSSELLLLLRVLAMYGQKGRVGKFSYGIIRRVTIAMYCVFVLAIISVLVLEAREIFNEPKMPVDWVPARLAQYYEHGLSIVALLFWFFNTLLFALTLMRVVPVWLTRTVGGLPSLLLRDGSAYYALVVVLASMLGILPFKTTTPFWDLAVWRWAVALVPLFACRLFLNMRELAARSHIDMPTQITRSSDKWVGSESIRSSTTSTLSGLSASVEPCYEAHVDERLEETLSVE